MKRASGIVSSTKKTAATVYAVKLKYVVEYCCACCVASPAPMITRIAVSFCRPMKSFRSGGITRRTACGTTTYRIDCR